MKKISLENKILEINVEDKYTILSSFSSEYPIITREFADYIFFKISYYNQIDTLCIKLYIEDIEEKDVYMNAIVNYYNELMNIKKAELKQQTLLSIILIIIGVFLLSITIILEYKNANIIPIKISDILAWVFIWEATDIFFLQSPKLNMEIKKIKVIIDADIKITNKKI